MDFQNSFGEIMDSCQRNVAAHRAAIGSLRQLKLRTLLFVSVSAARISQAWCGVTPCSLFEHERHFFLCPPSRVFLKMLG
jgi:hypothetical protein